MLCALILGGCSADTGPSTSSAAESEDASLEGPAIVLETATSMNEDRATRYIALESGEPTGTEPWIELDALVGEFPETAMYEVQYSQVIEPDGEHHTIYWWDPATGQAQKWLATIQGSLGSPYYVGLAPGIDRSGLHALATGDRKPPKFREAGGVIYTDPELESLDAAGVAEAYFACGNQEVEYWLSAPHVQRDDATNPWRVSDGERMWGVDDLVVIPLGSTRVQDLDVAAWPEQLAFDVTYESPAVSMHGEDPGPRSYRIFVGRQSEETRWLVLKVKNLQVP